MILSNVSTEARVFGPGGLARRTESPEKGEVAEIFLCMESAMASRLRRHSRTTMRKSELVRHAYA